MRNAGPARDFREAVGVSAEIVQGKPKGQPNLAIVRRRVETLAKEIDSLVQSA